MSLNPDNDSINMNDPAYKSSLTDAQAEVDDHLQAIREIASRYKLPYFIVINYPNPEGRWTTQMAAKVHTEGDAVGLFSTVDILLQRATEGRLSVAVANDDDDDDKEDWEGNGSHE